MESFSRIDATDFDNKASYLEFLRVVGSSRKTGFVPSDIDFEKYEKAFNIYAFDLTPWLVPKSLS